MLRFVYLLDWSFMSQLLIKIILLAQHKEFVTKELKKHKGH